MTMLEEIKQHLRDENLEVTDENIAGYLENMVGEAQYSEDPYTNTIHAIAAHVGRGLCSTDAIVYHIQHEVGLDRDEALRRAMRTIEFEMLCRLYDVK